VKEKTKEDCGKRSSIDFGEMVWGSCGEKTIFIRNNGLATVPLRLAIMSVSMVIFSLIQNLVMWLVNDNKI
jgi:hypothetical protein